MRSTKSNEYAKYTCLNIETEGSYMKSTVIDEIHLQTRNGNKSSAIAEMGDRLAMGRKEWGLLCPFPWRSWVPM